MYTNAVYFPNERIYQGDTPGAMNYGCINHVYYAFANVSPDGGVFVSLSKFSSHDNWANQRTVAQRRVGRCPRTS